MKKNRSTLVALLMVMMMFAAAAPAHAADFHGGVFVGILGPIWELCSNIFAAIFAIFGWTW